MAMRFGRKRSNGRRESALELMLQVRAILDVDADVTVSITEHDCTEPGCHGLRTVVLVLRPGHPTEAIKIEKPLECVTREDLRAALATSAADANACAAKTHSLTT
jgi:hypothetical protein